jgi:hypothetical protein
VKVKIIARNQGMMVVEWVEDGQLKRGQLPQSDLNGADEVDDEKLNWAMPWGEPWAEMVELKATSGQLEQELHKVGIWTLEDLQAYPDRAQSALLATYAIDYHKLLSLIRR